MKIAAKKPPRNFKVGKTKNKIVMKDCGKISLDHNEQVTFDTPNGGEYDVARKDWGFYGTPSLNGRLKSFGLNGVLVKNINTERYYILLVEDGKEVLFDSYCKTEELSVVSWLNSESVLRKVEVALEYDE